MSNPCPPGYYRNNDSNGIESLPWPEDLNQLPETLGFQIIDWCETNLVHHLSGEPWRFSILQKRFIVLWYALSERDRWIWRSSVMRLAKGSGKDPFLAAVALAEMLGPVKFSHRNAVTGRPVGMSHQMALVIIAANSEAQAQETLLVANGMVSEALRGATGYDAGKLGSSTPTGSRIKLMTNSVRTAEGAPATCVLLNESHHMTESNGGMRVADVARRNTAKSPDGQARVLEATNAHEPGGDSVAERTYEAWQDQLSGPEEHRDILYCSVEADPSLSFNVVEEAEEIVRQAYYYSPWISKERILAEVHDLRTTPADAIRFFANGLAAAESAWIEPNNLDLCSSDSELKPGDEITLALDCSKSDDTTALTACRMSDGMVFEIGHWTKPHGDRGKGWLVPRWEVDDKVTETRLTYKVLWFGVDPSPTTDEDNITEYWGTLVSKWAVEFRKDITLPASTTNPVLFDHRMSTPGGKERVRQVTDMAMQVRQEIDEDHTFKYDGSVMTRLHMINAKVRPNQFGISIGKENRTSPRKVDLAMTVIMSRLGRSLILSSGKQSKRSGLAYV